MQNAKCKMQNAELKNNSQFSILNSKLKKPMANG